jgi:type II secretory pathway pseudopilin PulG
MPSKTQKIIIGVAVPVLVVFAFLGLILGAAVSVWKAAQKAGNEAATIQNIKTIAAVEIEYYNAHNRSFGTFEQLIAEQMLSSKYASQGVDSYVFTLKVVPRASSRLSSYTLNCDPVSENTGRSHFYLDSTSATIHVNPDQIASANDPPLEK